MLEARILSVADVVEAMFSHPYILCHQQSEFSIEPQVEISEGKFGVLGRFLIRTVDYRGKVRVGQDRELSRLNGHDIKLSASIGVAFYPDDDSDGQNLLRYADQAMYVAKQTGRNQFHFFNAVTN
ncbi:diguanylate cyclase domain-containing protein [Ferrovum myxofaciens]|jgi:GGDEF domain-containing protein|uniref:Diguanylate cyclase n=2 Tax=root TaxID=1 RepID=A0A9E6MZH8_9PROT|nr:diguanylate cyclase [Ferrovum myxofaciens]MBU6993631.1 diguanylate cyclase [Ferrovum myxofaciens]QKE37565.1 MAG: diguanylate cyclase [Ferrovum myxofaciens]QWY75218.1 MAG: diguanylate cyclase [Ferrovum myxofaciens]QWY77952.1 MAG: diguanylate cyclase [Ferrovum myxofaciens]